MFSIARNKIRPIVSLPIDQSEKEWNIDVENIKEPFLFLKRERNYLHTFMSRICYQTVRTYIPRHCLQMQFR